MSENIKGEKRKRVIEIINDLEMTNNFNEDLSAKEDIMISIEALIREFDIRIEELLYDFENR